ncbi:MAG: MFS transporter [Candidatus Methanodesulfokora sp.]|jgi:MFS family permease
MRKYASAILASIGGNFYSAVWPFIVAEAGVDPKNYGLFSSISGFTSISSRILVGFIGSSRSVFSIGVLMYAASSLVLLLGISSSTVLLALIFSSTGFALTMIGIRVLSSSGRRRGLELGFIVSSGNLGVILGGYLGVLTNNVAGRTAVFLLGALISLSSMALIPQIEESTKNVKMILLRIDRRIRKFVLISLMDSFTWAMFYPFFFVTAPKVVNATDLDIATAQAGMMLTAIIFNPVMGGLSDKGDRGIFMAASEFIGALLVLIYGYPAGKISLFMSSIFMGLVIATWDPVVWAYIADRVPREELLLQTGVWSSLTGIMRAVAPFIGGLSYSYLGHSIHMTLLSFLLAILSILIIIFLRK